MIARTTRVLGRPTAISWALVIVLALAGCGESGTPKEVAPEARKALDRRKVDAQPKAPKSPKAGATSRR